MTEEIQIRKLLLDFYSSELTTHSRLIIGFSVLLFTILSLAPSFYPSILQKGISLFSLWLVAGTFWYLIMRHISYGILSNATLHAVIPEKATLEQARNSVVSHALNEKILGVFPSGCFISAGGNFISDNPNEGKYARYLGFIICFIIFGIATSVLLSLAKGLI